MAKRSTPDTRTLDPAGFVTRGEFLEAHAGLNTEIGGLKTEVRAMGVMMERMDSNIRGLAEAVVSMGQSSSTQLAEVELRLSNRITVLESVVRENSVAIQKNSTDIRELRLEVHALRRDFDHRAEARDIEKLDARVTALEAKARLRPK